MYAIWMRMRICQYNGGITMIMMKKTMAAALFGMLVLSVGVGAMGGSGTKANPYTIASAGDFTQFATDVTAGGCAGKYYKQTADIDLSGKTLAPLGTESVPFMGDYDGAGFAITGYAGTTKNDNAGLFGYVRNASLHDMTLEAEVITACVNYGGIAAIAEGSTVIENCNVSLTLNLPTTASPLYANGGGIVGKVGENAKIVGCTANATAAFGSTTKYAPFIYYFGGIAGENLGTIDRCTAAGSLAMYSKNYLVSVGGIVGENLGTVSGCTNTANVSAEIGVESAYAYVGGIAGTNGGILTRSINNAAISGKGKSPYPCYVGGIVGYNGNGDISLSKNTAKMTGTNSLGGGIAGVNFGYDGNANVTDCLNTGSMVVGGVSGGLVGDNAAHGNIESTATVSSSLYYGAVSLIGMSEEGSNAVVEVKNAFATNGTDALGTALKKAASYTGFENGAWIFVPDVNALPELLVVTDLNAPAMVYAGNDGEDAGFGYYIPENGEGAPTKFVVAYYKENKLVGMQVIDAASAKGYFDGSVKLADNGSDTVKILPFASLNTAKPAALEAISFTR